MLLRLAPPSSEALINEASPWAKENANKAKLVAFKVLTP